MLIYSENSAKGGVLKIEKNSIVGVEFLRGQAPKPGIGTHTYVIFWPLSSSLQIIFIEAI